MGTSSGPERDFGNPVTATGTSTTAVTDRIWLQHTATVSVGSGAPSPSPAYGYAGDNPGGNSQLGHHSSLVRTARPHTATVPVSGISDLSDSGHHAEQCSGAPALVLHAVCAIGHTTHSWPVPHIRAVARYTPSTTLRCGSTTTTTVFDEPAEKLGSGQHRFCPTQAVSSSVPLTAHNGQARLRVRESVRLARYRLGCDPGEVGRLQVTWRWWTQLPSLLGL
jgi:hypothetical protein